MLTLPIDLGLSVAAGSTVALAGRSTAEETKLVRSPALWALVAFELLVFVPVGAYLLWRFPAWSVMYLIEPDSLPMPPAYLAVLYPIVAVGTFVGCRRLLAAGKLLAALGIVGGSALLVTTIAFFGWDQISVLGTTEAFRADPAQMRDVGGSSLAYTGGAGSVAVAVSWSVTLWRLMLLGRLVRPRAADTQETAEERPQKRSRRTKKKKAS